MPSRERELWRDLPKAERAELRRYFRALKARYGPFRDLVACEDAREATEAWWRARYASGVALVEATKRRRGKGRRPNLQAIDRRFKRAYLAGEERRETVRGLAELAARRPSPALAALLGDGA